jgi:hypothetical protein
MRYSSSHDLTFWGAPEVNVEVLTGLPGPDFPRSCYAEACWQFFANGTFLFTPGAAANVRDDLYPLAGAYRQVENRLELQATRRAELGASVALVGFLTNLSIEPRIVALQATASGPNIKIVSISQALRDQPEENGRQEWPPLPSTFDITLLGHLGNVAFGPLAGLVRLRSPAAGDPNPFSVEIQSSDLNQPGSLYWTSFLSTAELRTLFSSVTARPEEGEIVVQLLPSVGNLKHLLGPSWLRPLELPGSPELGAIPDWIYAEQGSIHLHLSGSRLDGEISARGQDRSPQTRGNETYEARITGSLRTTALGAQPPVYPNPFAGETLFEGAWRFKRLGLVHLRQTDAKVDGMPGDGARIKLSGQAEGNLLALSWNEEGGGQGTGYFIALPGRHHIASLLLDTQTNTWRAETGEQSQPVPIGQETGQVSRQDLKYHGYDLVMEGRCAEAIRVLESARALYRQDRDRSDVQEVIRDSSLIDEINILTRLSACYTSLGRFDDLLASLRDYVSIIGRLASREYLKKVAGAPGTQESLIGPLETYRRQLTSDLDKIQALDASRAFFEELVDLLLELDQEWKLSLRPKRQGRGLSPTFWGLARRCAISPRGRS